ncbi:hypothetical protein [uncultured Devosia sp.]|uniref:hypothetical protein n=1 Tax=uncultured Devosia sp. TaxID=211434 RepID=UPI00261EABD2|nr:hypothetical protein [uncultured Devosia sp.]
MTSAFTPEEAAVLRIMAEDAFDVLNWARRLGMKRDQQLDQVVAAYQKSLCDAAMCLHPIRASGTRPTGEPGANKPPSPEASGPVGRDVSHESFGALVIDIRAPEWAATGGLR